jgi:hypothetical protein
MYNLTNNGRINLGSRDVNLIVSIHDNNFKSQVEEEIWPCVKMLVDKGYITVGSCSGHGRGEGLHISIIFNNLDDAINFQNKIQTRLILSKFDSSYNFTIDWFNKEFNKNFKSAVIITIYPSTNLVYRYKFLKKIFLNYLKLKLSKL